MSNGPQDTRRIFINKVFTACGIIFLFIIAGLLLVKCFNVLLLLLAGVMIAVYFRGIGLWLSEKTRMSEAWSALIVIVGTLCIVGFLFWLLGGQIKNQLSKLSEQIPDSISKIKTELSQYGWGNDLIAYAEQSKHQIQTSKVFNTVMGFFKTTFGVLGDVYIILFLGVFFTATPYLYKRGILILIPPGGKDKANEVLNRIGFTLRSWFVGRILSMFAVFILTTAGLLIIGMPVPLALGFIAGVLNFVPNFGPVIALIPAILIGSQNGGTTILLVIIIYTAAQVLESNLITPLIQKKLINIAPALILTGQVILGIFGGLLGVLLATPFVAIIMVLINSLYVEKMPEKKNKA